LSLIWCAHPAARAGARCSSWRPHDSMRAPRDSVLPARRAIRAFGTLPALARIVQGAPDPFLHLFRLRGEPLMMHRHAATVTLVGLTAALAAPGTVLAEEAAPASPISANVSLTSNYKFRGQDQDQIGHNGYYKTRGIKPALQGGFDYAHESGFYV